MCVRKGKSMGKKYFVWSFDDGLEEDKEIVKILKKCNMGATFNLNSGLFGKRQMIGRIGNMGIKEVPIEDYNPKKISLLKYSIHYRIPKDEIVQVYEGFEVASHSLEHVNLPKEGNDECNKQVEEDVKNLEELFGQKIIGFAYPYGSNNDMTRDVLVANGIKYARTVEKAKDFSFPQNPLMISMTGWIIDKDILNKVQRFVDLESEEDQFFLMFAHGYELDFNTKECNFDMFRRICDMVAGNDDIICCSTGDALKMAGRI